MFKKAIFFGFFPACLSVFSLQAEPGVVPDPIPCVRDLEIHFFNTRIVNQGLSFYDVRQELWAPIVNALQVNSYKVPLLMKTKTAFMVPNPIEFPMQKEVTAKILKEALFEVFMETMKVYEVDRMPTARLIFDYIFTLQMPLLIRCFGEGVRDLQPEFD